MNMATKTAAKPAQKPQTRTETRPAPVAPRSTEVAKTGGSVAAMTERMRAASGMGVSTDQSDNLVPLIYVLQPLSPQVLKGNEKQIEGAEAGFIWLRNDQDPLIDGDEGMLFQPCYFSKDWVEWMPQRKGFVARHATRPKEAELEDVERDDGSVVKAWTMPSGNRVVETRNHVGFVLREGRRPTPYTIPLSSTGHTVSKAWMFSMNGEQFADGGTLPSFGAVYRMRTKLKSKNDKNWYQYEVEKECRLDDEQANELLAGTCESPLKQFEMGLALHNAFVSGEKAVDAPTSETDASAGDYDV